jgi:hypothetical protein
MKWNTNIIIRARLATVNGFAVGCLAVLGVGNLDVLL